LLRLACGHVPSVGRFFALVLRGLAIPNLRKP
jgi:hypothetical protein